MEYLNYLPGAQAKMNVRTEKFFINRARGFE